MIIVYASKTGFTKKYAELLAAKTQLRAFSLKDLSKISRDEDILFLGWMKAGKIQGLAKIRKYSVKAVCGSGTGRTAEPGTEAVIARNFQEGMPFFYLRGGCFPLKDQKGMDRIMMSLFLSILKKRQDKDERIKESISHIENGFDGVKEENLQPVLEWLDAR